MKMKKGGLLLKFMSMILVIFLVTPMVLELGIVASFASTYYKKYQKDEGVYIYDDIQGSLSVTYRVYGHFYEESYGGLYAKGDMDTTETVKVPITVSVSRSYNPNSKYEDMRYKYTYDIKAQSVDGNWSAQDYTVAPGLDHDLGSWVLANGSVTASVPKISQWEGKYASTDYDKSIPISEKINTDGVSMSVSSFKDMNPDWFVKDDWYSLNVNVLKANVEFEIPAFTQLTVKWDEGVSTVYDYWSQHNHSDLGELVNGGKYLYQKGDRAYTFINLKEGYDFDYIGEGSNDHHWTDTKWNDTEKWWENSWSMANNREIYIHTKKQIKTLNLSWDSGVNMVIGHSTEGSDMQMPNGSDVGYYYGATAPACIYLNSGYDIDYIEDLNSGEKIYVSSSDWNEDNSRYDKYFEMKQDRKLKIHTKPKTAYIRTFSGKGISSTNYASGSNINIDTEVTVTATVKTGYKFVNWTDSNGNEVSKDKDYTFAMPGNDVNLTANAELNSYPVTVNVRYQDADGNWGAYETVINSNYDYGSTVSWSNSDKINSDAVYKAAYKAASYSETVKGAVTKNIDIERNKYTITVNKGSHISSVSGGGTYYYGKKIQISATPDTGYSFSGWNDSDKSNPRTITVTGNVSYTANAKVNQYAVTYIDVADSIDGKELGRITRQIDYGVKVDGSDLGADKTLGKYYAGYEYASSTNATVGLDGATVYRIFRIHNYSITYNLDGGILPDGKSNPATYTVEDTFTLNNPAKPGYTFAGWSGTGITGSDNKTVTVAKGSTGDRSYTAQWTADTNTKYVVNHWKQNIGSDVGKHDSGNYTLAETYNLTGITDTSVTPAVKTYTGFTSPVAQTVNINGDGSTVVNYYYTRNKYKIDDDGKDTGTGDTDNDKGNGIKDITGGGEYYYEEEVSMEAVVKRGYHWHIDDDCHTDRSKYPTGWTVTKPGYGIEKFLDNTNYGTQKIRFVMPAHDVYVRADATNNSYTIEFERNGGTGNMPAIEATYAVPVTLPDNSFTKTTAFGNSTFLYWEDTKNDTTYDDKSVVESLTDEFNGTVILKAAWDDCPEITAQERWFTVDDSQNGKITLEELLSTAKVTDDRDSDIEEKLTVKYYQPNLFTQFKTDGYVMVTYTATDSSNNTTEVTVKVNIVDTVAVEQEKNTYARFIAPQYYKESYENGGLEDDSIWKKDPDYAAVLESAMNNRESMYYEYIETELYGVPFRIRKQACEYSDHLMEKWVFTKDDVKAVKKYVNEHGIGNLKEADALANFRIQFAHCRQQ